MKTRRVLREFAPGDVRTYVRRTCARACTCPGVHCCTLNMNTSGSARFAHRLQQLHIPQYPPGRRLNVLSVDMF